MGEQMSKLIAVLLLAGCVDTVIPEEGDGELFTCTDSLGVSADLCWNGTADELSESTTWTCSSSVSLDSFRGCEYTCPRRRHAKWWSWCP